MPARVPGPERLRRHLSPLILAGVIACVPAHADPPPKQQLDAVEKAIGENRTRQDAAQQRAAQLESELTSLRAQSVAAAAAAQAHEAALTVLDARLTALAAKERHKQGALAADRAHETALLMALTRLAATPPEAFALAPLPPVDALRGALVMGRAVPALAAEAANLKEALRSLAATRIAIETARTARASEKADLAAKQAEIASLMARTAALRDNARQSAAAAREKAQALAGKARNLRDLIARLDAEEVRAEAARQKAEVERQKRQAEQQREAAIPSAAKAPGENEVAVTAPPPRRLDAGAPRHIRPFSEARGAMVFPASGVLVGRFGVRDAYGQTSHGLTVATRPGAIVVAPFDGQVMFAGPFHGYGQILIISHGDGYHSLLAGLDHLDSRVGQWLVAGEPVGTMSDAAGKPRLYFELRHNDQPINPSPWLSTRVEKVNG